MMDHDSVDDKVAAFDALAGLGLHMWLDLAARLTCTETEVISGFIESAFGAEAADLFRRYHAEGDDLGDLHRPDGSIRQVQVQS